MKKYAWTMAELTVIIIIMLILTKAAMSITKSINVNKSRIFAYSAVRNLTMGNIYVRQKNKMKPEQVIAACNDSTMTNDWYCMHLADTYSLKSDTNCAKTATANTVNFTLANGISVMGAASAWKTAYTNLYYKDILVDTDGTSKGVNKIGVDRFPLRVFLGKNAYLENLRGLVVPVNCQSGQDIITTDTGTLKTLTSPYCSGVNNNMANDSEIFAYDVYVVKNPNKANTAGVLLSKRSVMEADCLSNGGRGIYGHAACKSKGYRLHEKCAHSKTCKGCEEGGTCPTGYTTEEACITLAENNKIEIKPGKKKGHRCVNMISKPTGGMGMLGGSILGEMGI